MACCIGFTVTTPQGRPISDGIFRDVLRTFAGQTDIPLERLVAWKTPGNVAQFAVCDSALNETEGLLVNPLGFAARRAIRPLYEIVKNTEEFRNVRLEAEWICDCPRRR